MLCASVARAVAVGYFLDIAEGAGTVAASANRDRVGAAFALQARPCLVLAVAVHDTRVDGHVPREGIPRGQCASEAVAVGVASVVNVLGRLRVGAGGREGADERRCRGRELRRPDVAGRREGPLEERPRRFEALVRVLGWGGHVRISKSGNPGDVATHQVSVVIDGEDAITSTTVLPLTDCGSGINTPQAGDLALLVDCVVEQP